MSYIAPTWVDGQAPAINATRLNALCGTVANLDAVMPNKQDKLTFDNTPTAGSNNPVKSSGIKSALDAKQNKLTFDNTPTAGSNNPVKSSGIKSALDGKAAASHTHAMSDVTGLTAAIQYGPTGLASFQGSEDFPLAGCVAEITPVQTGSGEPSPTNVRPISGWTEAKVYTSGKNMLPPMGTESILSAGVQWTVNGDGTFYSQGISGADNSQPYQEDIFLRPGTYWLSGCPSGGGNNSWYLRVVRFNGSTILGTATDLGSGAAFTITGEETRINLHANHRADYTQTLLWKPQIEAGSSGTAYEPYIGQTIDVTFPSAAGTVYGGTLDVLSGVLTVDRGGVDLGTLNYTYNPPTSTRPIQLFSASVPSGKSAVDIDLICSIYKPNEAPVGERNVDFSVCIYNSTAYILDSRYTLAESFKTAVAGQTLVYPLNIPYTYQLTPQQVTAVAGSNHVWADTGNVTVEYGAFPGALQRELPRAFETYYITTGKVEDAALGDCATAEGYRTTSSGSYSHAEGYATKATGWGYGSHAEGANTYASGYFSHAEGINTLASGADPSVPEYGVEYGGSHAEGFGTIASGEQSHAEGRNTTVAGNAAHAEGRDSSAGGDYSHAEGRNTDAVGTASHAEGYHCQALKSYSHAEGSYSKANGVGSHAEGYETIANGDYQHVFGKDNAADTTSVEIVGWGTSSTRKNIRTLDTSGNMTIAGTLTQSSDSRLKTIDGEIPDVSNIHAVRFRWNDENGTHDDDDHVGYIAQEVEKLAPFMVKEDSNGYKALDYIALLCAKMELLERRVKELEKKKE